MKSSFDINPGGGCRCQVCEAEQGGGGWVGGQRGEGGEEGLEEEELVRWESMSSLNTTAAQALCLYSQT